MNGNSGIITAEDLPLPVLLELKSLAMSFYLADPHLSKV
jgi:hypothetical protein